MSAIPSSELTERIVEKAKSLGAAIVGVASVESLKESPSHRIYPKIGMNLKVHWQKAKWIENTFSIKTYKLPYFVSKGGIFLKDAAVVAGLGCLGRNNLVITPGYGPWIRFRALLIDRESEATGPLEFNPCEGCERPCREACPVKSFKKTVYSADALDQSTLPGINGTYDRVTCNRKMDKDIEEAVMAIPAGDEGNTEVMQAIDEFEEGVKVKLQGDKLPHYCVKYCRKCELACPVGK